jgi:hypothetical protein
LATDAAFDKRTPGVDLPPPSSKERTSTTPRRRRMSQSPPRDPENDNGNDAPRVPSVGWSDAAAVRDLLRSGVAIELFAKGRSMEPTLREGQPLRVEPLAGPNDVPRVGEVVLVERRRQPLVLLLHRVAERRGRLLVLEGDATLGPDDGLHPVSRVLGRIVGNNEPAWRFALRRVRKRLRAAWKSAWLRVLTGGGDAERGDRDSEEGSRAAWTRAFGLWAKGQRDDGAEPPRLDADAWRWLQRERLAGAAARLAAEGRASFEPGEGAPDRDTPEPAAIIAEMERRWLSAERAQAIADAALAKAGVRAYAMRGLALAKTWPSPSARESSDLDLLVAPEAAPAAVEALLASGAWALEGTEGRLWRDAGLRSEILRGGNRLHLAPANAGGSTPPLELHWRTLPREGAMLLCGEVAPSPVEGLGVREMAPEEELLLGALHWAKHHFRPLRDPFDAATLIRAAGRRLDWKRLVELARGVGGERALFARLWAARELYGAVVPPEALKGLAPSRLIRPALEARFGARGSIQRSKRAPSLRERALDLSLTTTPSARRWARLVRWLLAPGWPYLLETYGERGEGAEGSRRIGGGWPRAWHRFLWRRAESRLRGRAPGTFDPPSGRIAGPEADARG